MNTLTWVYEKNKLRLFQNKAISFRYSTLMLTINIRFSVFTVYRYEILMIRILERLIISQNEEHL